MTFNEWLLGKIRESSLSNSEIGRRGGISHARISQVLAGEAPGVDFCKAIARGLQLPPEEVLRMAGHLPAVPPEVEDEREMIGLYRRLDAPVRRSMLETMRSLLGLRLPRVAVAEERSEYDPEPHTLSEHLDARLSRELAQLHPDDAELMLNLMERLRGDRRGVTQPRESSVSSE